MVARHEDAAPRSRRGLRFRSWDGVRCRVRTKRYQRVDTHTEQATTQHIKLNGKRRKIKTTKVITTHTTVVDVVQSEVETESEDAEDNEPLIRHASRAD